MGTQPHAAHDTGTTTTLEDLLPTPGDIVRVRARQYLVEAVEPAPREGDDTLIRLSCLEDDAQGDTLEVLWEREIDARLPRKADWKRIASRGFDAPRLFSAYLHTLRWNCVTATDPRLFQAPYRAGIEVKAYQLEPLRMALGMPRINLFIADDVGLGKTIEAGLILREMLMRQKVRRCVVCAPPSVVLQWRDEMEQRFGLTFVVYDRDYVTRIRQQRGYAINPFETHTRFIISQALIRDEAYAAPLRDWLGEFAGASMLILDEAHNVAPASGTKYAVDSKLTRTIRDLAPRFEHRLFLSATPHNGHSNSFSALLELLDPQRFCRGVPVDTKLRDEVMVRRLKSDLRALGEPFPERHILRVVIDQLADDAPSLALSRLLQQYRTAREARLAGATKTQQASAMLVVTSLQKRLLSSIEAFARTLAAHSRAMDKQRAKQAAQSPPDPDPEIDPDDLDLLHQATGADDERAELSEDEVDAEADAQMETATRQSIAHTPPLGPELELLDQMTAIAEAHRHGPDERVHHLIDWIRHNQCPDLGADGATWLPRRVLIFTEYADTKRYLQQQLAEAIRGSDLDTQRIETFHGSVNEANREAIKAAFNSHPDTHPLRILIATDAAREGVNLQNNCADLFHFDVPWNPGRLEQRNGRIDRKLQQAPVVRCHYFVLPQRAEDRVLDVLVKKTQRINEELGSMAPVVERRMDRLLRRGIEHHRIDTLTDAIDRADDDADSNTDPDASSADEVTPITTSRVRTLRLELGVDDADQRRHRLNQRLEELQQLLQRSQDWIGLDDRHFRDAISASLETIGVDHLEPLDAHEAAADPARARWQLPHLHERKGADPTWAATLDTLRAPRKRGQNRHEWRREAPIRPVVFRDPGNLDGEVVHLHLEHRVVQRLLGRFLSQGFREDDLTRACVLRTDEAIPHVVLLGRLSLFGPGGARLHDEVLAAAAEWKHPDERTRNALRRLGEGDKADVLRLVEESLARPHLRDVAESLRTHLRSFAELDVAALQRHLERRAATRADRATAALHKRGDAEARGMADILEAQRQRIDQRQREVAAADAQLELALDRAAQRQLAAERTYWKQRLAEIADELAAEPERIRQSYAVRATRVEPVGLVYLWPISS